MAKIICLANSWKLEERCIAGINIDTGKWIRPVCDNIYPTDGRVPKNVRLVEGREPSLLDILDIPLEETGNDFGFECENRSVQLGKWKLLGNVQPTDIIKYCENYVEILHNNKKYVYPSDLQNLPFDERRTLQLIYATEFSVEKKVNSKGWIEWRGNIETANGQKLSGAKITDPVFVEKLDQGHQPGNNCIVTVSLGLPWSPPDWEDEKKPCWKLIAGVIELCDLPEFDLILFEMLRLGWSIDDGRLFLQKTYNKKSRQELSNKEIKEFFNYLKSLNS